MQAVLTLMAENKLNIKHLISHRFEVSEAHKAYSLIAGKKKTKTLCILFEYDKARKYATKVPISVTPSPRDSETHISVGFIGAGSFARSFLLPHIGKSNVSLVGIADIQGPVAKTTAEKYGFSYCTSDYQDILKDKAINTIFIATRHDMHGPLIIEALNQGKHVFCEKPMCLNIKHLNQIIKTRNTTYAQCPTLLYVGFNRRFAPLARQAKEFMGEKNGPYVLNYRINAGMIPPDHWLFDSEQGGGRIIGEVCHFVDLAKYFIGARLMQVHAMALGGTDPISRDNTVATLSYEDGSIATISYFAVGDKDYPKEYIEIFGDQKVCIIDDFKKLTMSESGRQQAIKRKQDKGYSSEIREFFHSVESGTSTIIPFDDLVETTKATFAIEESMQKGRAVDVADTLSK
jgi:predicted dehydrogenase